MLSKEQERLIGKSLKDMTSEELSLWIDTCDMMENAVDFNKARRNWTKSREETKIELKSRESNMTLYDFLDKECIDYIKMTLQEIKDHKLDWRYNFNGHKLSSSKREYNWHVFSYNYVTDYLTGEQADDKYCSLYVKDFVVIGSEKVGLKCSSDHLPELNRLKKYIKDSNEIFDLYITHKNFNWTYVISHEDDFGPYYAEKQE